MKDFYVTLELRLKVKAVDETAVRPAIALALSKVEEKDIEFDPLNRIPRVSVAGLDVVCITEEKD